MLFFLSLLSSFLAIILLIFNANKNRASVYLSSFFLLLSLYGLLHYLLFYSGSVVWIGLAFFNFTFLSYLIGPVFYWYIRSVLTDNPRLFKRDLLHLLPAVIFFLTSLPYILTPWSHKLEIAEKLLKDVGILREMHVTPLYDLVPEAVIICSRPVFILLYAIGSAVMLIHWVWKKRAKHVLYQQRYVVVWLSHLLISLIILALSNLLILVDSFVHKRITDFYTLNLFLLLSVVGFSGMLILPFFFPFILYGLPRLPESMVGSGHRLQDRNLTKIQNNKRFRLRLESDYLLSISEKTGSCMRELKPFLQSDFNLVQLSSLTHIPLHHLAYYFRESRKQSFNDYKNFWRIEHAKELILDGKADKMTLEAIGTLSGFTSRNTFFIAFKKAEGISPNSFFESISTGPLN
jgi:AraC-like DNA-binding protein